MGANAAAGAGAVPTPTPARTPTERILDSIDVYVDRGPDAAPIFPGYGSLIGFEEEVRARAQRAGVDAEAELEALSLGIESYRSVAGDYLTQFKESARLAVLAGHLRVERPTSGAPMSVEGADEVVMAVFTSSTSDSIAALVVDGNTSPELLPLRQQVISRGTQLVADLESRLPRRR